MTQEKALLVQSRKDLAAIPVLADWYLDQGDETNEKEQRLLFAICQLVEKVFKESETKVGHYVENFSVTDIGNVSLRWLIGSVQIILCDPDTSLYILRKTMKPTRGDRPQQIIRIARCLLRGYDPPKKKHKLKPATTTQK